MDWDLEFRLRLVNSNQNLLILMCSRNHFIQLYIDLHMLYIMLFSFSFGFPLFILLQ